MIDTLLLIYLCVIETLSFYRSTKKRKYTRKAKNLTRLSEIRRGKPLVWYERS